MKCVNCNGKGLVGEKLCPVCNGFGYIGAPEVVDIEHIVTEEEVKDNNLEGKVEAGEKIIIKKKSVVKKAKKK